MKAWTQFRHLLAALMLALLAGGCATSGNPADPIEGVNRAVFTFNEGFDKVLLKPVATGYKNVVPEPARQCVSNVFANVNDIFVSINSLLQGKVGDAISDACRVLVNTTVGIGGCFDVASKVGLEKHMRDFGQTFGKWGFSSGPYVVLPFIGPSSVRDGIGTGITSYLDPIWNISHVPTRNVIVSARAVSIRSDLLSASNVLEEAALDKYSFVRDAYLQRRQGMVEEDEGSAPAPGKNARGEPLPLAFKGAIMPTPTVPAELWFDDANQRAAAAKPATPTDNAARRGNPKAVSAAAGAKSL